MGCALPNIYSDLIGKNFSYDGRGPDTFDCYGLCIEMYKRLGKELVEYKASNDFKENADSFNFGKKDFIKLEKPEPFCLVFIRVYKNYVSHVGVVLEDCKRFIHICDKRPVCIELLNSDRWKNRIDGYWKYTKN